MADLHGEFLERAGDNSQCRKVKSMAVALNDLIRDQRRFEAALPANISFDFRRYLREGADGAGNLSDADVLHRFLEALSMPGHFLVPKSKLETERNRFGVHAVRAPNHDRAFVFMRLAAQHLHQVFEILVQNRAGFFKLNRQRRIHHVRRGHTDVQIASIVADRFRHCA